MKQTLSLTVFVSIAKIKMHILPVHIHNVGQSVMFW